MDFKFVRGEQNSNTNMATIYKIVDHQPEDESPATDGSQQSCGSKCISCLKNPALWKVVLVVFSFVPILAFTGFALMYLEFNRPRIPRLPDLVHENLPFVNIDFVVNLMLYIQIVAEILSILINKRRLILLRRVLSVYGILILLRDCTMLVTCLPDPSTRCNRVKQGGYDFSIGNLLSLAFGGDTCGDMIFSGHTIAFILPAINHTTFLNKKIAILFWINGVVGAFLLIIGHIHYTFDVVTSFFLTVLVFSVYNTLADNPQVANSIPKFLQAYFNFMEWPDVEIPMHEYSTEIDAP